MVNEYIKKLVEDVTNEARGQIEADLRKDFDERLKPLVERIKDLEASADKRIADAIAKRLFVPNLAISDHIDYGEFLRHSTCSAADFYHPRYAEVMAMLKRKPVVHRKAWEFVYVVHKLLHHNAVGKGKRGLVFGVGNERLPSLFASMGATIVATDAPPEIGIKAGWSDTQQHASSLEQIRHRDLVSDEVFDSNVTHRYCDMNAIDSDLTDFDFTWSSCCFEHLGTLEAGVEFVVNSVEKTLKVGGIAVHTTEFNLSSDVETVEKGSTVIYRRRDIQALVDRLRGRGHEVEPFSIAPDSHYLDYYVDVPPYRQNPHIKLMLGKYVSTSVGIVVKRGAHR